MQTTLLTKCHQLIKGAKTPEDKKRLEIIKQMLETPNCFVHLNANVAINVLMQLGYKKDEAKRMYLKLSSFSIFKGEQK